MTDTDHKDGQGKVCTKCGEWKLLEEYHSQPKGRFGKHSHCAKCANEVQRLSRIKNDTPEQKRKWSLKTRYGITPEAYDEMFASQDGKCAICQEVPARRCVDHDHDTGQTRGILCHYCNIRLPAIENANYRLPALAYLAKYAANDNQPPQEEKQCTQITTTMACAS